MSNIDIIKELNRLDIKIIREESDNYYFTIYENNKLTIAVSKDLFKIDFLESSYISSHKSLNKTSQCFISFNKDIDKFLYIINNIPRLLIMYKNITSNHNCKFNNLYLYDYYIEIYLHKSETKKDYYNFNTKLRYNYVSEITI